MALCWLIYAAAVIGCAAFRAYYIGWFGVFIFRAAVLVPLVTAILSLPGMLTARIRLRAPRRVLRGCGGRVRFTLKSRLPFGGERLKLCVRNHFTGEETHACLTLDGGPVFLPLPCDKCGVLSVSVVREYRRDLTGLLRIPFGGGDEVRCTVLPSPEAPDETVDLARLIEERQVLRPRPGAYSEEHEVREYRPGDPMRSIHWKLSSKMDRPVVREPQADPRRRITVELDPAGDIDRALSVMVWVCETLFSMELECDVLWHSRTGTNSVRAASSAALRSVLETLLSEAPDGAPQSPGTDVRCRFIVRGGEVTAL